MQTGSRRQTGTSSSNTFLCYRMYANTAYALCCVRCSCVALRSTHHLSILHLETAIAARVAAAPAFMIRITNRAPLAPLMRPTTRYACSPLYPAFINQLCPPPFLMLLARGCPSQMCLSTSLFHTTGPARVSKQGLQWQPQQWEPVQLPSLYFYSNLVPSLFDPNTLPLDIC